MNKSKKSPSKDEMSKRAKALQEKINASIAAKERRIALKKKDPEAYQAGINARGFQRLEEATGKKYPRVIREEDNAALKRFADFANQYPRKKQK